MRKSFPKRLDKFSASPVGDRAEFAAAFAAVKSAYPDMKLGYVGYAGGLHYFQVLGDPVGYAVPASDGWIP